MEDALSHALQIGSGSTNEGLKNASFYFVDNLLPDFARKGALHNIPDWNIKKLAQSFSFINVFTWKAPESTHFVRPVAKFIHGKFDEQTSKVEKNLKGSGCLIPDSSSHFVIVQDIYPKKETVTWKKPSKGKPWRERFGNNNHGNKSCKYSLSFGASFITLLPSSFA